MSKGLITRRGFLTLLSGAAVVAVTSVSLVGLLIPEKAVAASEPEVVIVSYKGNLKFDSGYFYCPYIPLMM